MSDPVSMSDKPRDPAKGAQPEVHTQLPPAATPVLRLRCPHCHNPLELADEQANEEVLCPACGSSFRLRETRQTTTTDQIRPLGKFQLLERVGLGAFGTVWRARDTELHRIVALKLPHAGLLASDTERERFYREARLAAQLRHPGIVTVHDVATLEGTPAIVAEFIDGLPLRDLLRLRPLTFQEAAALMADIADAVDYAHQMGLVHRDLKPSNIMIEYLRQPSEEDLTPSPYSLLGKGAVGLGEIGRPRVMDFGLALRPEVELTLTVDGQVLGTPAYMSPEQAAGKGHRADGRSDVYSLGVIFYEMLSGELPFRGSKLMLLHQVLHEEPRPPRKVRDKIPRDLETICLKAMAKSRKQRYQTAGELADDLRRYLNGEPIRARPVGMWERGWRWARRRPAVAGLLLTSLIALLTSVAAAVALVAFRETEKARQEAVDARADANEQRALARRYLYASDMNLAGRAWQETNISRMLELLERHRPQSADQEDLRGFEWYYLWRLCHGDLFTLKGHTREVFSVAFSPDGQRLASASLDGTVKVWNARTGQETLTLKEHTSGVTALAFSPDGQRLASASQNWTVKVWDARTGKETRMLKGHRTFERRTANEFSLPGVSMLGVAFSPDGQRLASAGGDGTVKVWDVRTGEERLTFKGYTNAITGVAFSPDGKRLAFASLDGIVKLFDVYGGEQIFILKGHSNVVNAVGFSPDGQRLASAGGDGTVKVWDVRTGEERLTFKGHTYAITCLGFSPDGQRLASASVHGTVKIWNPRDGQETLTLKGHTNIVFCVAFSPDGLRLASAGQDQTVRVWDVRLDQESLSLKGHKGPVIGVTFSPDGKQLASAGVDRTVKVWDARSGQQTLTLKGHTGHVSSVAFSPDGQRLASACDDGTVKLWDALNGLETQNLKGHSSVVNAVAFSPDGQRLASASGDQTVKLWDARTGQESLTLKGHSSAVTRVAFSLDGQWLASASGDQTVKLWDARTGQVNLTLRGHTGGVTGVAFSSNGLRLASASFDGTLKLWNALTGQEILTLKGHSTHGSAVAFHPDGQRLASAGEELTVKLWDAVTGQETLMLKGLRGSVMDVAFSPDGHRLASAGADGTVKVWETIAPTEEEMQIRRALVIVRELFETLDFQEEVVAHLRQDRFLSEPFKSQLIALAKVQRPNPDQLNNKSWTVVREANPGTAARELALRQAQEACRIDPDNGFYFNTLGVALYRSGRYQAALEVLTRSEKLNAATFKTPQPADLAFLAMAHHQLGQKEQARTNFRRLQETMKQTQFVNNEEAQGFLREAEALLKEKAENPKK